MICSCGSTTIHDHKTKFAKYLGRHYWEVDATTMSAAIWERRSRRAGFKSLTEAKRAARPFRRERVAA